MSFTSVQTKVAQFAINRVNNEFGTQMALDKFQYVFPDKFRLENLYVPRETGDTMAFAKSIVIHFTGYNSLQNAAYASEVNIDGLRFDWYVEQGEKKYNFVQFINGFTKGSGGGSKPFKLNVAEVNITDAQYILEDLNCETCYSFDLKELNIDVENFELDGAYLKMDVKQLSTLDLKSVQLETFKAHFELQEGTMLFEEFDIKTSRSTLAGNLKFEYDSYSDFNAFVDSVAMTATLVESAVDSKDIIYFAPTFPDFGKFNASGKSTGFVNDLDLKEVYLSFGKRSNVNGDFHLLNTAQIKNVHLETENLDLVSNFYDIQDIVLLFSDSVLDQRLAAVGDFSIKGKFNGHLNQFRTDVNIETEVGQVNTAVYLKDPSDFENAEYLGDVTIVELNLGELLDNSLLDKVSSQLKVRGRGYYPSTMKTRVDGEITDFGFKNYNYQQINVNGNIANGLFDGLLRIIDPNIKLDFDGNAGFRNDSSKYDFKGNIEYLNLYALNFVKDSISVVTGDIEIKMMALNYDRWEGDIDIRNFTYENHRNFHFFHDIIIHSEGLYKDRFMELKSNIIDAKISGEYTMTGTLQAFGSQVTQVIKTMDPIKSPENQNFEFDIELKNTQVLSDIFQPDIEIEPFTTVEGNYSSESGVFNVDLNSVGMSHRHNRIEGVTLDYKGSPTNTTISFNVDHAYLFKKLDVDSISLGNFYYNDSLFYDLRWIVRDSVDSKTEMFGYAIQEGATKYKFGIQRSKFNVGRKVFNIRSGNVLRLDTGGFHIKDLIVEGKKESVVVNGNISKSPYEVLRVDIDGFDMNLINYFIGSKSARFNGDLSGNIIATQLLTVPKIALNMGVNHLVMNESKLGDLKVHSDWAVNLDTINIEATLSSKFYESMSCIGFYQPDSVGKIGLDFSFNKFKLEAFNPFLRGLADNVTGLLDGKVRVGGNYKKPEMNGGLKVSEAGFKVNMLNTHYKLDGINDVKVEPDGFSFDKIKVIDTEYGTQGSVSGKIGHYNFNEFSLDIKADIFEMLVLNTTALSEDPYYGKAFATGKISFTGPLDEVLVSANIESEKGTEFYLPIDLAAEENQLGFVTFVDHTIPDLRKSTIMKRGNFNKGVSIDFNIDVNQNAEVYIIIDSDVGNQLEGKGNGRIKLLMKPNRDLEMYGSFSVLQGTYNFALPILNQKLLSRKFDVLRGGSVSWNGDPYEALIDITARYTTKADPKDLIPNTPTGGPTLTILDLQLSGELMNPNINFEVSAPRAPSTVQAVLNNQTSSQDNLYNQAFSILAFNRFAPSEGIDINSAGKSLGYSALASQAANYLNLVTGNFEVSLDYQAADPTSTYYTEQGEVEVGVSTRLYNDRVYVNTSMGMAVAPGPDQSQFAGDIEIEYSITEDGRFRAKAFNRAVQNDYNFGQQNYQQGIGIFYRLDFDYIFKKKKTNDTGGNDEGIKEEASKVETETP